MSAGFTPGPWQVLPIEADATYLRVRGKRPGTRYKVANVLAPIDLLPQDAIESVANARLIAAAPELLSIARRWAALDAGGWHVARHAWEKAQLMADTLAAIAKAAGSAS